MSRLKKEITLTEKSKVKFFKTVIDILEKNNIKYFLEYGSLLGLIRDNSFLSWDGDIDLVTFDISPILELKKDFEKQGLILKENNNHRFFLPSLGIESKKIGHGFGIGISELGKRDEGYFCSFVVRKNILSKFSNTILNILEEEPMKLGKTSVETMNNLIKMSKLIPKRKLLSVIFRESDLFFADKRKLLFGFFDVKYTKFYGIKVKIPSNPEEHILLNYGKNWRIPDKNFGDGGSEFIKFKEGSVKICHL